MFQDPVKSPHAIYIYRALLTVTMGSYRLLCRSSYFEVVRIFFWLHLRYLKRLVQNREWEKELMKDRDDWIPGTYFGEPVFHNKDFWNEMHQTEFNAHSNYVSLYVQNKWTNYRG